MAPRLSVSAVCFYVVVSAWTAPFGVAPQPVLNAQEQPDTRAFMKQYCLGCHNEQARQRGAVPVALEGLDLAQVARDARTWEQVVRKMRAGVMPPNGAPRPEKSARERVLAIVEGALDRRLIQRSEPGMAANAGTRRGEM